MSVGLNLEREKVKEGERKRWKKRNVKREKER